MILRKHIKLFILIILFVLGSAGSVLALVQPRGTSSTFDLLTWNVKQFPTNDQATIDTLAILINDLDVDMIAFQEITNVTAFNQLLTQSPGWDGVYSPDNTGLRTALIWRTDRCNVTYVEQLFTDNFYEYPRPPIHLTGDAQYGANYFDFHIIIFHLKAGSDEASRLRREAAIIMLKDYLDTNVPISGDQDWIVLGDWNDELDDPISENVFTPLLNDSLNYTFLTLPLAGNPYWASYPSWNSLIDHIMITNDALTEYDDGTTITLRLDDEYSNYLNMVSDHRPVMAQFNAPEQQYEQLLLNGDFELWDINGPTGPPDYWSYDTGEFTATQEVGNVHGGNYSNNLTWTSTTTQTLNSTVISVEAGVVYTCSLYVYDNDPYGRARACFISDGGNEYPDQYSVDNPDWQLLVYSWEAPAGATQLTVQLRMYDVSPFPGTATVYVDDMTFWGPGEQSGNNSPMFVEINQYPWPYVFDTDDVNIEALIMDLDGDIVADTMYLQTGAGLVFNPIMKDSLVNGSYWYNIGNYPIGTLVDYYLVAVDDSGAVTTTDTFSYIVQDPAGPEDLTIAHVQYTTYPGTGGDCYPSIYLDSTVTLTGKVIGRFARSDRLDWFYLQDSDTLWSGIYVYNSGINVNVGDSLTITASVDEYFGVTELESVISMTIHSTGNDLYQEQIITCADLGSSACDFNAEQYENQFVKMYNITIGDSAGYGDFWAHDSSGDSCLIDDDLVYNGPDPYTILEGETYYSITGVCIYHHDYYRIAPRSTADFVEEGPIGCAYNPGDVNSPDGLGAYNGLDITYGVSYFKGGPQPLYTCECTPGNSWFVSGDANGSCTYNGLDITYGVAYFKGGPPPVPCADCPPVVR
jgi:endonuclease/exonuclease/phosphatase family metal-dependent hydrolase